MDSVYLRKDSNKQILHVEKCKSMIRRCEKKTWDENKIRGYFC